MLKLSALCVLLTSVAIVLGAEDACTVSFNAASQCVYTCTDKNPNLPGMHTRDRFGQQLRRQGYHCKPFEKKSLICFKKTGYGKCSDHTYP